VSLLLFIFIVGSIELWKSYLWGEENTSLINIENSTIKCEKIQEIQLFELKFTLPSGVELFINEAYKKNECELWKTIMPPSGVEARYLESNGLIVALEENDESIYSARSSLFGSILLAGYIWAGLIIVAGVIQHITIRLRTWTR